MLIYAVPLVDLIELAKEDDVEDLRSKRQRTRSSLLLLLYAHEVAATTYSLEEFLTMLKKLAPFDDEESLEADFVAVFNSFVKQRVLPKWTWGRLDRDRETRAHAADGVYLEVAETNDFPLITYDGFAPDGSPPPPRSMHARALRAGVSVTTPEGFLDQQQVDRDRLVRRFFCRWNRQDQLLGYQVEAELCDPQYLQGIRMAREAYRRILVR